jgi:hypothetical protein
MDQNEYKLKTNDPCAFRKNILEETLKILKAHSAPEALVIENSFEFGGIDESNDTSRSPDEILLDVRTPGGMSGAPIFRPSNGEVVGIHYAGWEATTALGLPLIQTQVDSWIEQHNEHLKISRYAEDSV